MSHTICNYSKIRDPDFSPDCWATPQPCQNCCKKWRIYPGMNQEYYETFYRDPLWFHRVHPISDVQMWAFYRTPATIMQNKTTTISAKRTNIEESAIEKSSPSISKLNKLFDKIENFIDKHNFLSGLAVLFVLLIIISLLLLI